MMLRDLADPFSFIPYRSFSSRAVEIGTADTPLICPFQLVSEGVSVYMLQGLRRGTQHTKTIPSGRHTYFPNSSIAATLRGFPFR